MKKLLSIAALALSLGACAQLKGEYALATTSTVPSSDVVLAANSFDILKATASNYGNYCINQNYPKPVCSAANRRLVIKAVNSGASARIQLESSMNTGQPALSTVYNILIAAVKNLNASPINTVKGS